MTPREYMRACGVPDDVEVATYVLVGEVSRVRAVATRGAARDGTDRPVRSTSDIIGMPSFDGLLLGVFAVHEHETFDDAIAWIARKR